jgi:hypothetical protein
VIIDVGGDAGLVGLGYYELTGGGEGQWVG